MPTPQADGPKRVTGPANAALAARVPFIETLRGQIAPLRRKQFGTPKLALAGSRRLRERCGALHRFPNLARPDMPT